MEINQSNITSFIDENNTLTINEEFLMENGILDNISDNFLVSDLRLKELLQDSELRVRVTNITTKIKINFFRCILRKLTFSDCNLENLTLNTIVIENELIFNNCKIEGQFYLECELDIMQSNRIQSVCIANNSYIKTATIFSTIVEREISLHNSEVAELDIQGSTIESFTCTNLLKENIKIGELLFADCTILKVIKIWKFEVKKILIFDCHFGDKSKKYSHADSGLSLLELEGLNSLEIKKSKFFSEVFIAGENAKKLVIEDNQFNNNVRLLFNSKNIFVYRNRFNAPIYIYDRMNFINVIVEFCSNVVYSDFDIIGLIIEEKFLFESNSFKHFPSVLDSIRFVISCTVSFKDSYLSNCVFRNIDLSNISLIGMESEVPKFENCKWNEVGKGSKTKIISIDERNPDIDLKLIKSIYSSLKSKFKEQGNYLDSGKFHISEQDVNLRILKKEKLFVNLFLLCCYRKISYYGESVPQALKIFLISSFFFFPIIYLFSGFENNSSMINYDLAWEFKNCGNLFWDFCNSIILSFKNVIPNNVSKGFYLKVPESYYQTQNFMFLQNFFNLIFLAALIGAINKFLKK